MLNASNFILCIQMKSSWLFVLVLIFCLSSCDKADDSIKPLTTVLQVTPIPENYWDLWISHSPNGEWDVYLSPLITTPIITSTFNGTSFKDNFELSEYNTIASWFPDSSGFITFDANHGCQKCPWDRLTIYHINADTADFSHFEFVPLTERNKAFWHTISWSLDGLQFAVIVGGEEIFILDQYANVIGRITPQLNEADIIDQVVWSGTNLIYAVRTLSERPHQPTELRMMNLDGQSDAEIVLRRERDYPHIISVAPQSDWLLIAHNISGGSFIGEIGIFSVKERQFIKTIFQYDDRYPFYISLEADNQQIVGLQLFNKGKSFFVFDWATQELVDTQIPIDKLLGWRDDQAAFIVLRGDNSNSQSKWIELISP